MQLGYLSSDLAVPASADDASSQLVTVIVAETLEQSCSCFHQWLLSYLHPSKQHHSAR